MYAISKTNEIRVGGLVKCAICQREMYQEKRYLYFKIDRKGIWVICKGCEQTLNCITNPRRMRWVHLAIEKVEKNLHQIDDELLVQELQEDIDRRKYVIGMHKPHL